MSRPEAWQLTETPVWETRSPYLVKTVLAQKKELESQSTHDKARLRLEGDKQRKKAVHLDQQYKQLQGLHKYQGTELNAVKTALRKRDLDISQLQERLSGLEETVLIGTYAEKMESLQVEHKELQEQLTRTMGQLQAAQQSARDQETRQAELDQQASNLDKQRQEMMQATNDAQAERNRLNKARQKCEWKEHLVEELIEALLSRQRKSMGSLEALLGPAGLGSEDVRHCLMRQWPDEAVSPHCRPQHACGRGQEGADENEMQDHH